MIKVELQLSKICSGSGSFKVFIKMVFWSWFLQRPPLSYLSSGEKGWLYDCDEVVTHIGLSALGRTRNPTMHQPVIKRRYEY
jgi:hypothetical protein